MRVGVVGFGYWGVNITRNFIGNPAVSRVTVADLSPVRLKKAREMFPSIEVAESFETLIGSSDIDLIAIVTPVRTHFELARTALLSGKHVLVEKPFCYSSKEGRELIALAEEKRLVLAVDHTFIYTPAVQKIHELIQRGRLGKLWYFDSVRINLGLFQHDVNVVWDLAVHDLSILLYTTGMKPVSVSAHGVAHTESGLEDIAYLTLHYETDFIAHMHLNWLAPTKIRQVIFGGSEKMLLWDDLNPSEKIRVYDKGISYSESAVLEPQRLAREQIKYRSGDMWSPALEQTEALTNLTTALIQAVEQGAELPTPGRQGLDLVCILEACQESISSGGKQIRIDY